MSVRCWMRRLGEIRDAVRALPAYIAAHDCHAGTSIRDRVQEIESSIESTHGDDERRNDVTEVLVAPTRQGRVTALETRVGELEQTVKILCDRTHESSFHVADPEVAPSGDPATIMAGTPDADPSQGDGASVEGPAPRSGPSTSSKRPVNDYIAHRVKWILFIRQIRDREFAAAIGVSPSTVSRLLSGERRWRAETIRSTARFLDMSADDLFPPRDWGRS